MKVGCPSFERLHNRRRFLQLGGTGLFGLTWGDMFRAQAQGAEASALTSRARAKQVLFIWLHGGPPQTDMYDMKPNAREEIRGPFKPIQTKNPELQICEHLPNLAAIADKYTVIRSLHSTGYPEAGGHHAGLCFKTGNPRGLRGTPKYPMYGCVTSKLLPTPRELPPFVALGDINSHAPDVRDSFLGAAYDPLSLPDDRREDPTEALLTPATADLEHFNRTADLLKALEQHARRSDAASPLIEALDLHQQKAFDLLRSPKLRNALNLEQETPETLERYGCNIPHYSRKNYKGNYHAQKLVMSRRLIEAGVPFVYADFCYWDWHGGRGLDECMPDLHILDAALPALLNDLEERGLLETTMVMALGEMGRTPEVSKGKPYGREHWAHSQFVLVAGGGFAGGRIVGATDAHAAYVTDKPYKVASLGKTMYHLLGINPDYELYTTDNRPLKLITEDVPLIDEALV